MGAKVEVKTIPLHGLFIYRKQVWRSLGKLRAESHSTSAQKVYMNEHNTEASYIVYLQGMYKRYGNISIAQLKYIERNRKKEDK